MSKTTRSTFRQFLTTATLIVVFSTLVSGISPLWANEKGDGMTKPAKLFTSNDTLSVTLTGPWRDIERNRKNQDPYPAKLEFTDESGQVRSINITAERRGLTRQRACRFPPIKLRFEKESVKGTVFRGQKSLKMVTHCEKAERFEQYFILEMLAYRMYNLITDYSFRVRPLTVNYMDSETGKTDEGRFAFLIEDDGDVADRHDLKKLNVPKVKLSQLEPGVTSEFSLFQYMIANVDWATLGGPKPDECCHNSKLIGPEPLTGSGNVYPIPYDFDSSGLVDAPYATPPEGLPIRSVSQRLFRGYCKFDSTLESAREKFLARETDIYALMNDEDRLSSKTRSRALKYIGNFFEIIKDPKDFEKRVTEKCRK